MPMRIRMAGADGARIRLEVSARRPSDVTVAIVSGGVSIVVADPGRGVTVTIRSGKRDRPRSAGRQGQRGQGAVSPAMEIAAVEAFLGAADVTRLGRSLSAVYGAMEAVRRGTDPSEYEGDDD